MIFEYRSAPVAGAAIAVAKVDRCGPSTILRTRPRVQIVLPDEGRAGLWDELIDRPGTRLADLISVAALTPPADSREQSGRQTKLSLDRGLDPVVCRRTIITETSPQGEPADLPDEAG